MNPEVWGPQLWSVLHSITFNYPIEPSIEVINHHRTFLHSLKNVIPCETCSFELIEYIDSYPPELESKPEFINWMIDLHNNVNRKLDKREYTYSEVILLYNATYSGGIRNYFTGKNMLIVILCMIIIYQNIKLN